MAPSEVTMETSERRKPGIPPRVRPSEVPMEQQEKRKHGRPPRVAPITVNMVTQEDKKSYEINKSYSTNNYNSNTQHGHKN